MLIVVMQIYVKDIIETKTNKKLHLPGTGGKQSEDIRQSSFFEKLHQLEGSVQEVFSPSNKLLYQVILQWTRIT